MTDEEFNTKLKDLIAEIVQLPQDKQKKLTALVEETKERHADIRTAMSKAQQSLLNLQICLKYVLFDLEATRRERDKFKGLLDTYHIDY
jgi:septal ring factor EnvC (AmiA/AmiB activator)